MDLSGKVQHAGVGSRQLAEEIRAPHPGQRCGLCETVCLFISLHTSHTELCMFLSSV